MTANQRIIEEIRRKLDLLPMEKLQEVLEFLESLEGASPQAKKILSYAGIWKDMEPSLFEELATRPPQKPHMKEEAENQPSTKEEMIRRAEASNRDIEGDRVSSIEEVIKEDWD